MLNPQIHIDGVWISFWIPLNFFSLVSFSFSSFAFSFTVKVGLVPESIASKLGFGQSLVHPFFSSFSCSIFLSG